MYVFTKVCVNDMVLDEIAEMMRNSYCPVVFKLLETESCMVITNTSSPIEKPEAFAIAIELLPATPILPDTAERVASTEVLALTVKVP